jgi:hypothetical protein
MRETQDGFSIFASFALVNPVEFGYNKARGQRPEARGQSFLM